MKYNALCCTRQTKRFVLVTKPEQTPYEKATPIPMQAMPAMANRARCLTAKSLKNDFPSLWFLDNPPRSLLFCVEERSKVTLFWGESLQKIRLADDVGKNSAKLFINERCPGQNSLIFVEKPNFRSHRSTEVLSMHWDSALYEKTYVGRSYFLRIVLVTGGRIDGR